MAALWLSFGVFTFLQPGKVRSAMDNFADAWKKDSWHPYRLPLPVLRWVVAGVATAGAALFVYMAYVDLTR